MMKSTPGQSLKAKNAKLLKELEIEAALERVRASAMAMHKTEDLHEAGALLFKGLAELGINTMAACYALISEDEKSANYYGMNPVDGKIVATPWVFPHTETEVMRSILASWKQHDAFHVIELDEQGTLKHHTWAGEAMLAGLKKVDPDTSFTVEAFLAISPPKAVLHTFNFPQGYLFIATGQRLTTEQEGIALRFTKVFEMTYRRFLDLKHAEEQARESQIQLALERVRARTMAMQKSEELRDVIQVIFDQLQQLNFDIDVANFALNYKETDDFDLLLAVPHGKYPMEIHVPYFKHPVFDRFNKTKKKGNLLIDTLTKDEKDSFFEHFFKYVPGISEETKASIFSRPGFVRSSVLMRNTALTIHNYDGIPYSEAENNTLLRFGQVFDQTYTRFSDLKRAEEQAKEAQIQLALERVRARTMAMQKSGVLKDVIQVIFDQLHQLNFYLDVANFTLNYQETDDLDLWIAVAGAQYATKIHLPYYDHPVFNGFNKAKAKGGLYADSITREEKNSFFEHFFKYGPEVPGERKAVLFDKPGFARSLVFMKNTALTIINYEGVAYSEAENSTLLRFGQVFDQTYTRFKDLEQAEGQAREAQIQLGLERVRAKAMAMQTSEELNELIGTVFGELTKLDFVLTRCLIMIFDPETNASRWWMANSEAPAEPMNYLVQNHKNPAYDACLKAWKERNVKWRYVLKGKVKRDWDDFLFVDTELAQLPAPVIEGMKAPEQVLLSASFNNFGCLTLVTLEPLSDEHSDIMLRFAKVFDMCYTRFNDLKQAEEQAREAKIEASLERVRSRTMAMQHSDELKDVIQVIYEQLHQLNFNVDSTNFAVDYRESDDLNLWVGVPGQPYPAKMHIPYIDHPIMNRIVKAKGKVPAVMADCYPSNQKNTYFRHIFKFSPFPIPAERQNFILNGTGLAISTVLMNNVALSTLNYSGVPYTDADNATLMRFGKVFEQTYTRFKDLEQAEEQAREAQIQLGLERVRARAMAMQSSGELAEVVDIVFKELTKLDFGLTHCAIAIADADSVGLTLWQANSEADQPPISFYRKSFDHPYPNAAYKEWEKRTPKWVYHLKGAEKKAMHDYYASSPETMNVPNAVKEGMAAFDSIILSHSFNNFGYLRTDTTDPLSENNLDIVYRFAKAFDLCYTRFTDIKQAEAQAKESQIQLALERVRARTMAMQRSEELAETATVLFQQLYSLDVTPERVFIGVPDDRNRTIGLWGTEQGGTGMSTRFEAHADEAYSMSQIFKGWEDKKTDMTVFLSGEHLDEHINYVANIMHMPVRMELVQDHRILYCTYFSKGMFVVVTPDVQSEETLSVLRRFAAVFDQTYTRFLDLQKAEAQARESQIQLGLERVRAAAMAMHDSNDVGNATALVFSELYKLGITTIRCGVCIIDGTMQQMEVWSATSSQEGKVNRGAGKLDMTAHPLWIKLWNAWKQKQSSFTYELKGKELADYYKAITNASGYHAPDSNAVYMALDDAGKRRQFCNCFLFNEGCVFAFTQVPFSTETSQVLEKFTAVFGLTYRRYLDLTRAEAQAREAQIESALERVRSKTMAMHNSEDVADTVATMFNELVKLGVEKTARCGISIIYDNREMELWRASYNADGKADMLIGRIDMTIHSSLTEVYQAWKNNDTVYSCELTGNNQQDYFRALNDSPTYPVQFDLTSLPVKQTNTVFFFPEGCLFAFTLEPLPEETVKLFKRFAGVFGQTYRRYLDLLKAETAAREARIEATLERVRSKTMAMHNSADVGETVTLMFNELVKLGVDKIARCGIAIPDNNGLIELWTAKLGRDEKEEIIIGHIDTAIHPMLDLLYDAWKSKQPTFEHILKGDDLVNYITALNNSAGYPIKYDMKAWGGIQYHNDFFFAEGMVFAFTFQPLSAEIAAIFKRFAGVFGQTYRRYLDLQKAEAAAREAQIEAALERVRSKAMAMRSSSDLNDTANTVFIELRKLGVDLVRCGLGLMEKETHISTIHAATNSDEGGSLEVLGNIDMNIHPVFEGIYNQWRQNKDYFPVLEGESLKAYYEKLHESGISVPEWKSGEKQYGYFLQFAYGSLYAWSGKQESEITIKTLKRFTSVIGLTYTRYIELQKAESNTKEAVKQASLDRVRAEIASMRKRSDLERITPLIWDELTILGIPFIRCGVFIMDEEQKLIHTFLSTPDGKAIGAFHIPFDTSGNFEKMVDSWRHGVPYIDHWEEEAFSQFADTLVNQGAIASKAQYMRTLPHEGIHLNFLPFLQGMLYVGNKEPVSKNDINLVQAVADAFSTAYARYEDFNKLEAAKQQVDNTLTDLKAAQTKLIQSEKMASLGELTAGIAHEIQNPLNFVNNFSEVSAELIDEMDEELDKGDIEEAKAIAVDIKENLQKIRHHGGRADGIVKGMLQHSRASSGQKDPTDLNALADEYLRLAYHGLRAKDKSFNIEMVTHFDAKLPKALVVPQDVGRVLINLYNNAFYATQQKAKSSGNGYKPEVTVTTSAADGQATIKVKDNGNGIPDVIKDKIMQPFFTTKPTGEGTGLGLSLSYDIVVKGHGGKMDVETKEDEFTEFTVSLPLN